MLIRCQKCNRILDLKSFLLIQSFVKWEMPIKCKCGNEIYYKGE